MKHRLLVVALGLTLCSRGLGAQEPPDDPRVVQLISLLPSPDAVVRMKAGHELLALGPRALRALLDAAASPNAFLAGPAREFLTAAGPGSIDSLSQVGSFNIFDHRARFDEATAAVARMGTAALPHILNIFTTGDPAGNEWWFAANVLAQMDGLAVEPLIPLLKHRTAKVRGEAAATLAHLADLRSYDAQVEGLGSADAAVRKYCALGLGNLGDHRSSQPLLDALRDQEWVVRQAAGAALGKIYEPRFLVPLAKLARADEEKGVRDTASNVLMYYSRDPAAVRIGKRYKPLALSPAREEAIQLGFALRLGLTGLVLMGLALWLPRKMARHDGLRWMCVALAVSIAATTGFLWGRVVEHIWSTVENLLLFALVPAAALGGYALISALKGQREAVRAWLMTVAGFYLGYGVGWLALWGYLGV